MLKIFQRARQPVKHDMYCMALKDVCVKTCGTITNAVDDLGYHRGGDVTSYNRPITGENGDDVIIDCSTPTNQSAHTCAGLTSLETLFVNIQGLLNMAIERSRDREQHISYEKGNCTRVYQSKELINCWWSSVTAYWFRITFPVPSQPDQ